MCVAWLESVEKGPSDHYPTKGVSDGPTGAYPTVHPLGRGPRHLVLSCGRRLLSARPAGRTIRLPQATLGLGGPRLDALSATARGGIRALLLARGRSLFLTPLPRVV